MSERSLRIFSAFLLLLSAVLLGFYFSGFYSSGKFWKNPYPLVCDLVAEKIFLEPSKVLSWKKECLHRSAQVHFGATSAVLIRDLNHTLEVLKVSHLEIYTPADSKKIWQGQSQQNGISSEFVESELVIVKVEPGSPAQKKGLAPGQIIVAINGEQPSTWTANSTAGDFKIRDHKAVKTVSLQPSEVTVNESPQLKVISPGVGLWTVPSFRREFFEDPVWLPMARRSLALKEIVIDLRGNRGGNFVAGLKFLSLFLCQQQEVGILSRPQSSSHQEAILQNDLDDKTQDAFFNENKITQLRAFPFSLCYNGRVKVLVDGKTASVAEMVAQALKEFRQSSILGAPSAGELLVGVWYPLDEIAPGVQISIPEGVYQSSQGHVVEGQGVDLDRLLDYNLVEMQNGVDSWVAQSL